MNGKWGGEYEKGKPCLGQALQYAEAGDDMMVYRELKELRQHISSKAIVLTPLTP